ncbi:MAG: iron-containing alcohol dehydrogenase [Gammaproteobacteria bacterium]|nr:iron-containing alcohol dehydrogenase [Gammaproteobacteria bacterium]NND38647.1 iron-containing alcohol dehydrogenase [Pseudomonadales bacterium]NNM11725.1 iron-containing alcohol dehydrogenase [Pseudomonadales bacterium]RZV57752.1 MAG: iron-containing alcohol dehydrogenase [Pseudomonadales bacterium]
MKILYYKLRAILVTKLLRWIPRNAPLVLKGENSSLQLADQLSLLGYHNVLLVTDTILRELGVLNELLATLQRNGAEVSVYDGVLPDPAFDQVQAGEKIYRENNCDAIFAVGGGSVLDAAKMISMLHTNPGELKSFAGIQPCKYAGAPLFVAPTTAGTGSEITFAAIITDPVSHDKQPIIDSKMIPSYVALDPQLMRGMPPAVTAASGMDALTHAVESYLSKASTAQTELQAIAAVKLVFDNLVRAYRDGDDMEARDAMAMAAFYAGAAFGKTSVGYVHGIAHQLGRVCGTPHGNANAMVLPEVLRAYGSCVDSRLAVLARAVDMQGDSDAELASQFIESIVAMRAQMEMPTQPKGLKTEDIALITRQALAEAGSLYPVPRYMKAAEIREIVGALV